MNTAPVYNYVCVSEREGGIIIDVQHFQPQRKCMSEVPSDLGLDHVVAMFPHATHKPLYIDDMVCLHLSKAIVNGENNSTPSNTCTAVDHNRTGLGWIRSVDSP